jgi:hypothetical protein
MTQQIRQPGSRQFFVRPLIIIKGSYHVSDAEKQVNAPHSHLATLATIFMRRHTFNKFGGTDRLAIAAMVIEIARVKFIDDLVVNRWNLKETHQSTLVTAKILDFPEIIALQNLARRILIDVSIRPLRQLP